MVETTWVKNTVLGQNTQVPVTAIPLLAQSGWERMTEKEIAELSKSADQKRADVEQEMRDKAAEGATESVRAPKASPAGKSSGKSSDTKGNS
jgi:hypothetical protein